jgi:site-specific DNA-adenine methylase
MTKLKAPFPWFGGKRKVAADVWAAIGDAYNYVEPFAGSLAVLLARPQWHKGSSETVNDADEYIANFWRALAADPESVARYADWPVNETDQFARHIWLVTEGQRQMANGMAVDPDWYDAKIAGWWVWGISQWIGSGWCSGKGPWSVVDGVLVKLDKSDAGQGVNRQLPHLGNAGKGVNRQLPHLGDAGKGVHRASVHEYLYTYMAELAARLRYVRVCCGDWARVLTDGALSYGNSIGIFLDPPYSDGAGRNNDIYNIDSLTVAHDVRRWCLENGDNPRYRIVLAGYEDEHAEHMPSSWRVMKWSAMAAYNTTSSSKRGDGNAENRYKERLWFSPHCLHEKPDLFSMESE